MRQLASPIPLPAGFEELVATVMNGEPFSRNKLPKTTDEIWDNFSYFAFLDHNRTTAQVNFLYDTLESAGLLKLAKIQTLRTKWSQETEAREQPAQQTSLLKEGRHSQKSALSHQRLRENPVGRRRILQGE